MRFLETIKKFDIYKINYGFYDSPLGKIKISETNNYIIKVEIVTIQNEGEIITKEIQNCIDQLKLYFLQKLKIFDLKIKYDGTKFQKQVWNALLNIEYGNQVYYQDIANAIGNSKSNRAVANAISKNPIAIIIPCHRVKNKDKNKINYFYGKDIKIKLLDLEKDIS